MRILLIGASGGVGRIVLDHGTARGHSITALTRSAGKVAASGGVHVVVGEPTDEALLRNLLPGHDAVIFVLGIDRNGPTTLFSDATRALLAAMETAGVRRLLAVTGIGAGETRGHGGLLYDRIIFPLFTRHRYADKDRQEKMIEASRLDWTIVRPAPFSSKPARSPLEVVLEVQRGTKLIRVSREEVADFLLDQLASDALIRRKPFIGHRR